MEDRVLVGVDGSDASIAALDWGLDEAALRGLRVEVLMAAGRPLFDTYATDAYDAYDAAIRRKLAAISDTARVRHPDVTVDMCVSADLPANALIAKRADVALRVVGITGRGALPGSKIGSVAYHVAAHAPGPVVVVAGEPADAADQREVLVGVDGARDARIPLKAAYVEAQARHARIRAVHAWRYPVALAPGDMLFPVQDTAIVEAEEERRLAEALAGWKADDPDQTYLAEVRHAGAVETLARLSATAELLVVGARGRFGFPLLALGSVAHGVLHHARCPVLIAR